MIFAIDLRLMGSALALVTLIAGCSTASKPEDQAPRPATAATPARSQSVPSAPSGSSSSSLRPAPAATAPFPVPAQQPEPLPPPNALQIQLADAIRLFDAGEFYSAVAKLRSLPDLNTVNVETQLTAMKYLAFSYCVTNRRTLCQQQFEAALRVDPRFELAPAERGHPIWKVYFERAKQAVGVQGSGSKNIASGSTSIVVPPGSVPSGSVSSGNVPSGSMPSGSARSAIVKKAAASKKAASSQDASANGGAKRKGTVKARAKVNPKKSNGRTIEATSAADQKPQ